MIGRTSPHAARLRRDATDVERHLWQRLRARQLGGHKIRRQATIGPFVVDFLCAERRLVIELDGGQHGGARDAARTEWIEGAHYRVIRFWNTDVLENEDGVLGVILAALEGGEVA